MRRLLCVAVLALLAVISPTLAPGEVVATMPTNNLLTKIPYVNADGTSGTLAQEYSGKVVLVVNTASKCGYTPQYAGLETIYRRYKDQGLVVVAFPSNDYGGQEPGSNADIAEFCATKYNVSFPLKAKMPTKGDGKSPLYAALTGTTSPFPGEVGWNFEKFVIDRNGRIVNRFTSKVKPDSPELIAALDSALKKE